MMRTANLAAAPLDHALPPLVDPQILAEDPHAAFRALRKEHAIVRLGEEQYLSLRAPNVVALLTDPRTAQVEGESYARLSEIPEGAVRAFLSDFFLLANGADHRAKRALFARSFSLKRMRDTRGQIRATAERIARSLPSHGPFDFLEHMAARVPAEMIAAILGIEPMDTPFFSRRAYLLARTLSPSYSSESHAEIERAAGELFAYVAEQLRQRLHAQRDDLLSLLIADWQANPLMSFDSVVHQVIGLIIGGVDTTRAAFAMLVTLLLQHPEQLAAVRCDCSLIPGAVSEALRFEPSVGSIMRVTLEPVTIDGFEIPAGSFVRVSTMSAMRDPQLYSDPDRFDIHREDHPRLHAVFGHGPHRCIGEMLARFEMEEALGALLDTAPGLRLVKPPEMRGFGGIREISPMIVTMA